MKKFKQVHVMRDPHAVGGCWGPHVVWGDNVAHTFIGKRVAGHQLKGFLVYAYVDVGHCIVGGLLHELSNDGAREQFNVYLEDKILLQMVVASRVSSIKRFVHNKMSLLTVVITS